MPIMRKVFNCSLKHHPYLSPVDHEDKMFDEETAVKKGNLVSRSMCNIPEVAKSNQFIPRSMSAIEENTGTDGWKLPFCGVLSGTGTNTQDMHNMGSRHCGSGQAAGLNNSISEKLTCSSSPLAIPRSQSCQVSSEGDYKCNQLGSSPIPVPMRETKKRKSNFRSSGGYFFDKYMKRFRAKYGSRERTKSIGNFENTADNLSVRRKKKLKEAMKLSIRSNRQDMVFTQIKGIIPPASDTGKEHTGNVMEDDDDLHPVRCGSSSCWETQCVSQKFLNSNSGQYSDNNEMKVDSTQCSVFPSQPPTFWGDANSGEVDDIFDQPISPVSSSSGGLEASCRYSDSNSETLKAMETLYLCNFKVAVEGDWLCLKEICDDVVVPEVLIASTLKDEPLDNGAEDPVKNKDEMKVKRRNLLGMAKLSIKGLIESSLSAGHTLDSDHEPLQQFFVIIEYILRHGLKAPKNFFVQNKYFWPPLEAVEKLCPDAMEITNSVRSLPGVRTHLGRGRAWLRLALMQKKLSDYFKVFIENKMVVSEWYDDGALVMNDESVVLVGHLVGLNCIDANLCMKGDDLDNQVTVIDYSLYMKDGNRNSSLIPDENEETEETPMQKLVNQKNYLEERNRHLETISGELQRKVNTFEASNGSLVAELQALKIQLDTVKSEKERLMGEKIDITASHQKTLEDREKDLDTERETLRQSRAGLDDMNNQIQKQLKHETRMRMDVEKELELQMSLKQELEVAMKLLEKDIYDKQDGLITLREQLDNVKAINLDIYNKLQAKTVLEEEKNKTIGKLQKDTEILAKQVAQLQQQLEESKRQIVVAREQTDRYNQQLDDSEKKRGVLLTNLQIEREWRQALQAEVEKHQQEIILFNEKLQLMSSLKDELEQVTADRDEYKQVCDEQEMTIGDLAGHLGKSKQDFGDLKEVHKSMTSSTWEKDREISNCMQCEKPFSLARRKHHCRNCGQIFCSTCSDNTMPLASSAKPVRVCDACHTTLLQRFSAGT